MVGHSYAARIVESFSSVKSVVGFVISAHRYMSSRYVYQILPTSMYQLIPAQAWNGDFWEDATLTSLGLVFQLGHSGGHCPSPAKNHEMTVLHTNGIHTLRINYCGCGVAGREDNLQQLMRNAWYPASITDPHTCATYRVLETYRRLNVVANTNVRDFVTTLEEMSSAMGTTWVAVSTSYLLSFKHTDVFSIRTVTKRLAA